MTVLDSVDSTNNYLLQTLSKTSITTHKLFVVVSETQTNGRGRQGRAWLSALANSLTFSILWRFDKDLAHLSGLSLVIGLAVARTLRFFSVERIKLKWPNDILFNNNKIGGILTEIRHKPNGSSFAVIGIGINFYLSGSLKSLIDQATIDLYQVTGKYLDRNLVLGSLLTELRNILVDFDLHGFQYFKEEWICNHAYEGCSVYLKLPTGVRIKGIVQGVNDDGALNLVTNDANHSFNIGDVSLRLNSLV